MAGLRIWGRRFGRVGAGVVVAGLAGVIGWTFAISWRPAAESYPLQGVDASEAQGVIDWPSVRASGADFAYVRATAGADGKDILFAVNWPQIYAAGMRRGPLHQFSLCRLAIDQAKNFIVTVPRTTDSLPAAVQIDPSDECTAPARAVVIDEVTRFLKLVESHTGKPALLMIAPAVEQQYRLTAALQRPLWATGNFFPPTYTARPWRMWRASNLRRIEGVEGPIGWNVVAR
ncbi:MAG: GH25 family lysozyme [Pseudomonadota bacterium]